MVFTSANSSCFFLQSLLINFYVTQRYICSINYFCELHQYLEKYLLLSQIIFQSPQFEQTINPHFLVIEQLVYNNRLLPYCYQKGVHCSLPGSGLHLGLLVLRRNLLNEAQCSGKKARRSNLLSPEQLASCEEDQV